MFVMIFMFVLEENKVAIVFLHFCFWVFEMLCSFFIFMICKSRKLNTSAFTVRQHLSSFLNFPKKINILSFMENVIKITFDIFYISLFWWYRKSKNRSKKVKFTHEIRGSKVLSMYISNHSHIKCKDKRYMKKIFLRNWYAEIRAIVFDN